MNGRLLLLLLFSATAHAWMLQHWPGFAPNEAVKPGPMVVRLSAAPAASVPVPALETGKGRATPVDIPEPPAPRAKNESQGEVVSIAPGEALPPQPRPEPRANRKAKQRSHALNSSKTETRKTTARPRPESKKEPVDHAKAEKPGAAAAKTTETPESSSQPMANAPVQADAQLRPKPSAPQSAAVMASTLDPALLTLIHRAVAERKRYPRRARRRGLEGRTVIRFDLSPNGAVSGLEIREASGHGLLDRAAADAVRGIAPLAEAGRYLARTRTLELGVEFRLR